MIGRGANTYDIVPEFLVHLIGTGIEWSAESRLILPSSVKVICHDVDVVQIPARGRE